MFVLKSCINVSEKYRYMSKKFQIVLQIYQINVFYGTPNPLNWLWHTPLFLYTYIKIYMLWYIQPLCEPRKNVL